MSREEMDQVFSEAIHAAQYFLEKSGEFFPFAVALDSDGKLIHIQGWTGDEQPPSEQVREIILKGCIQSAANKQYRCTGIITDILLTLESGKTDAIRVEIENDTDTPVVCFATYKLVNGRLEIGEILAEEGIRKIFLSGGSDT
jgi:hypothetical protein